MIKDNRGIFHPLIAVLIVVVVAAAGFAAWRVASSNKKASDSNNPSQFGKPTPADDSFEQTIDKFITAMQKKDKATADSLFSDAAKTKVKESTDGASTSFYDTCQQAGQLFCTLYFDAAALTKYTKSYKDYMAKNGTKGKEIIYTADQSLSGTPGPECSGKSTYTMRFAAIPSGNSWLIDDFDQSSDSSANLCPAPGAVNSVHN